MLKNNETLVFIYLIDNYVFFYSGMDFATAV